jgi:hypothetical protein
VTRKPFRIAFVGRYYWHNGSSHALLGYVRAGRSLGYDVRASSLGIVDKVVREYVPIAEPDWKPDLMVLVFEERFLKPEGFKIIEKNVPRSNRLVIDPDGKFCAAIEAGSDTNHPTADSWSVWSSDFLRLSDVILQPRLGKLHPPAHRFLYFGIDLHRSRPARDKEKNYDIVYIGNNWYRWKDMVWLLTALKPIRQRIGRIAVFGNWWSGDVLPGYEEHTYSEPAFLKEHGVETYSPVAFDEVESVMGHGRLSPIFVRPVLNALNLVTPRMFETFAADTIPILPPYMRHGEHLYGPGAESLRLLSDPSDAVLNILENYQHYLALIRDIRDRLETKHCYEARIKELMSFIA